MLPSSSSIGSGSRWSRIALRLLAIVFAGATVLYASFWIDALWLEHRPAVELGLDFDYVPSQHANVVTKVYTGSPAERAGLRVGDAIMAFDGRRVQDQLDWRRAYDRHVVGDSVHLTVVRPGQSAALEVTGVFRPNSELPATPGSLQEAADRLLQNSLLLAFVVVGLVILLLRPEDRNVWLLACFFAGLIAAFGFRDDFQTVPAPFRPWVEVYKGLFLGTLGASFYFLCAVFPARSPLDRRLPWLKWVAVGLGLATAGEMNLPDVSRPFAVLSRLVGSKTADRLNAGAVLTFLALGLVSLAGNFFFAGEPQTRRKIRVIFWGAVVGLGPSLIRAAAQNYTSFHSPLWLELILNAMLLLVPVSFAYAVFKQRVLDIPVLLQRSARYILVQRGFLFLLCFVSFGLTLVFAASLAHLPLASAMGQSADITLGAVFGTALMWGGAQVHTRVSRRIDRAFFRSAYDARVILENLAATSRTATDRQALAQLLLNQLNAALQPTSLVVYLATTDDELGAAAGHVPPEFQTISCSSPLLVELARQGQPWELPPEGLENDPRTAVLAQLHSGCLVPLPGREGRLVGLLALGPRLSEEPYSGEDKRLLTSVASQAGMALENFRLAENIAEKMEAERRAAREMEIARDVQTRLLPQSAPNLKTLACAGQCLQAWRVGGDYYDFLELGWDQVGLVLADVSGKGVHAALLMANLQAHLRSLSGLTRGGMEGMTPLDLVATLQQINRIMWKSTAAQHYATLFFGLYDDITRRLTYANCGHNAPILLRAGGAVERLKATAMVIGLFEKWECAAREIQLDPGDLLAIFSDGVTEAMQGEQEFGEPRLLAELRAAARLPVEQVVTAVFSAVQRFSAGIQSDDLTLVVARAR
jgi:sigma-B regulation protein RsbU (phosphoserine phosphatase)